MVDYANVKLWGKLVGVVYWDSSRQVAKDCGVSDNQIISIAATHRLKWK